MRVVYWIPAFVIFVFTSSPAHTQEKAKAKVIWEGQIHLGDNPETFKKITSAGMSMQVPFKADSSKKYKLTIKASDVQTLAGDGHYVEVLAHTEGGTGPKETVLSTFRIEDNNGKEKDFVFEFGPLAGDKETPAFFSVRIRLDTSIRFGLWDDFLVRQITLEETGA